MPVFYVKMKLKLQATGQKREINVFNWMTLNTISKDSNIWATSNLLHLVYLLYTKMRSFAHIINEGDLTFPLAFYR